MQSNATSSRPSWINLGNCRVNDVKPDEITSKLPSKDINLFDSKFEIVTKNEFCAHISHWLININNCKVTCIFQIIQDGGSSAVLGQNISTMKQDMRKL